MITIIKTSKT